MRTTWPKFVEPHAWWLPLRLASSLRHDQTTPNCEATNLSNFAKDSVRNLMAHVARLSPTTDLHISRILARKGPNGLLAGLPDDPHVEVARVHLRDCLFR